MAYGSFLACIFVVWLLRYLSRGYVSLCGFLYTSQLASINFLLTKNIKKLTPQQRDNKQIYQRDTTEIPLNICLGVFSVFLYAVTLISLLSHISNLTTKTLSLSCPNIFYVRARIHAFPGLRCLSFAHLQCRISACFNSFRNKRCSNIINPESQLRSL